MFQQHDINLVGIFIYPGHLVKIPYKLNYNQLQPLTWPSSLHFVLAQMITVNTDLHSDNILKCILFKRKYICRHSVHSAFLAVNTQTDTKMKDIETNTKYRLHIHCKKNSVKLTVKKKKR